MLEEQNRRAREEQERKKLETQMRGVSEADAVARELKKRIKCQKIAVRIQAGDKVPPQDERYLQENDPQTYQLAIALRQPKKDPKEWDTLLEDEDREGGSSENTGETDGRGVRRRNAGGLTDETTEEGSAFLRFFESAGSKRSHRVPCGNWRGHER